MGTWVAVGPGVGFVGEIVGVAVGGRVEVSWAEVVVTGVLCRKERKILSRQPSFNVEHSSLMPSACHPSVASPSSQVAWPQSGTISSWRVGLLPSSGFAPRLCSEPR